jgi:hypothetical protein
MDEDLYFINEILTMTIFYYNFDSWPGDRFTKVIVNRKSKITLAISLRARSTLNKTDQTGVPNQKENRNFTVLLIK